MGKDIHFGADGDTFFSKRHKKAVMPRKPIARIGKRGLKYKAQRWDAKLFYVVAHGADECPTAAPCQSCGRMTPLISADYSHKIPAGRQSNANGPKHGIYSCRTCHNWLEHGPDAKEARRVLMASPICIATGGKVNWDTLNFSLDAYIAANYGVTG